MNRRDSDSFDVGLLGGSIAQKLKHSRVPPLDHAQVLAPFKRPADATALTEFREAGPLHIEIGFGRPHHLCDLAAQEPHAQVLGIEIRRRWVRAAARRAEREQLTNLRAIEGDARSVIEALIPSDSVAAYYVLFPDPWWKKRHHKRRVFRPDFIATLHRTLTPGGMLVAKTDVPAYAELIEEQLEDVDGLELAAASASDPILAGMPKSHREKKCLEHGIPCMPFRFTKTT